LADTLLDRLHALVARLACPAHDSAEIGFGVLEALHAVSRGRLDVLVALG
jgi:hypothetical protein